MPTAKETNIITKRQANALPFISKAHHVQAKDRPWRRASCGSSQLHLCSCHSGAHTAQQLPRPYLSPRTDCEPAEGRHSHLICHYIPAFTSTQPGAGGFPGGASGKEPACRRRRQRRHKFNSCVRKNPCRL